MAKNELGFFNPHSEESNLVGIVPQTREEQKAIINGLNSPDHKLSDYINLQLNIVNFYIERTEYSNDDNEVREGFRTILNHCRVEGKPLRRLLRHHISIHSQIKNKHISVRRLLQNFNDCPNLLQRHTL